MQPVASGETVPAADRSAAVRNRGRVFGWAAALVVATAATPARADTVVEIDRIEVRVKPTKAGGEAWDGMGNLPDPVVEIRAGNRKVASCPVVNDALLASCRPDTRVRLAGAALRLVVKDEDALADDVIGEAEARVTALPIGRPATMQVSQAHSGRAAPQPAEQPLCHVDGFRRLRVSTSR